MKRKVAMAMVAAMAVGSLAVPVMAEDGAAGGNVFFYKVLIKIHKLLPLFPVQDNAHFPAALIQYT